MSESDAQESAAPVVVPHDPYIALRYRDFRFLVFGRFFGSLGEQMASVAIGWELYKRTGEAFALGLVGLVQVLPVILLALPAGAIADRYSRKRIVAIAQFVLAFGSLGLALLAYSQGPIPLIYACLLSIGVARAFNNPASSTLLPQTVPTEVFPNAVTWGSSAWQLASVLGPALGGIVIALTGATWTVFIFDMGTAALFAVLVLLIRGKQKARVREKVSVQSMVAGASFVWRTKIILAAITLDMFAVLLGGATALLPIYALDILHVGASGLGWLRAAPAAGALLMAFVLTHLPPISRSGLTLLWAVTGFGIATIIFGLSTSFYLSLAMLFILGALDQVSVVIRSTLLLTRTPDEMRGRVSAVNSVFIGTSNELGAFESGVAAALFGPVIAVVAGGIGTVLVVGAIALRWPEVRQLGKLGADPFE
jgi:MFS family permease